MNEGYFYYLTNQYFIDFPDPKLMTNKEAIDGQAHDRPCFYAFKDEKTGLHWMIPFSSQIDKFSRIHDNKMKKFGKCDTILFGNVLGYKKAFLIQNMCPATKDYIKNQYFINNTTVPVQLDGKFKKELIKAAKKVLHLHKIGKPLIFPDVLEIEKKLSLHIKE